MQKTQPSNSGLMPGSSRSYGDFALLLASLHRTFNYHAYSSREDVTVAFFMLNGYLNTLARIHGVSQPSVIKQLDPKWYETATMVLKTPTEVLDAITSITTEFGVYETHYVLQIIVQVSFLLEVDKN